MCSPVFSDQNTLLQLHHAALADAKKQSYENQQDKASHSFCIALGAAKRCRLLELEALLDLISDYAQSLLDTRRWLDAFHAAVETVDLRTDYVKVERSYILSSKIVIMLDSM